MRKFNIKYCLHHFILQLIVYLANWWLKKSTIRHSLVLYQSPLPLNLKNSIFPNSNPNFEWRRFLAMEKAISDDICFRDWVGFSLLSPEIVFSIVGNRFHSKLGFKFIDFEFFKFNNEDNWYKINETSNWLNRWFS